MRQGYFSDHNCPEDAFRTISFETLGRLRGRFSPSAIEFLREATTATCPQPGPKRQTASPMLTASRLWCDAVTCTTCLLLSGDSTLTPWVQLDQGCATAVSRRSALDMLAPLRLQRAALVQGLRLACFLSCLIISDPCFAFVSVEQ
jgi:hypothetical protein